MSEAWLAVLVPIALMTATLGMQHLENRLLGPAPSTGDDAVARTAARQVAPSGPAAS